MAWDIVYFAPRQGPTPAIVFLNACPIRVKATLLAVLGAVASAPPPQFSGGGKWEAMHGTMGGYYEVRGRFPRKIAQAKVKRPLVWGR